MKWLKMDCDAQENLDMRKLVDEWGWEWYGRYWAICGKVGMLVTEKRQTFALQTNNGDPFPVRLLANDLSTNVERLSAFCDFLAANRLIDSRAWTTKKLIFIPKLRDRADEYTKKLLTKSRQTPEQEVEEEIEVDKIKDKSTLPVLEHWNSLAQELNLPKCLKITKRRARGIASRAADPDFDFEKISACIRSTPFLFGKNERGWRVDFDWVFCSPNNYIKILEGKYENSSGGGAKHSGSKAGGATTADDLARSAEGLRLLRSRERGTPTS